MPTISLPEYGFYLQADLFDSDGYAWSVLGATRYKTEGFVRDSITIHMNAGERIHVGLRIAPGSAGTVYIDDFQIEEGCVANPYNLVQNSEFLYDTSCWDYGDTPAFSTEYDFPFRPNGQRTIRYYANINAEQEFTQRIRINGKAGDVFSFGSWGWVESIGMAQYPLDEDGLPTDGNPTAGIKISYGSTVEYLSFNTAYHQWQMIGDTIILKEDTDYIDFTYTYNYNLNRGYFTRGYLFKEQYGQTYEYDANGNVVSSKDQSQSQAAFAYQNDSLSMLLNPTGSRFFYTYTNEKQLRYALSTDGLQYHFTYDSYGNPITTETKTIPLATSVQSGKIYYIINAASGKGLDNGSSTLKASVWEWTPGNVHQKWLIGTSSANSACNTLLCNRDTSLRLFSNGPEQEGGIGSDYSGANDSFRFVRLSDGSFRIDTHSGHTLEVGEQSGTQGFVYIKATNDSAESQKWYIFEVPEDSDPDIQTSATYTEDGNYMTSMTDARGNTTTYNTNTSTGLLQSTTDAGGNTVSYTYDAKNRLNKVQSGSAYNEYLYDTADRLSSIKHNAGQVQYTFGYDSFGRRTTVQVGNRELSTNQYDSRNRLNAMEYGNNASVHYGYDTLDRLTEKWYNENESNKVYYFYDYVGRAAKVKDMFADVNEEYIYDMSGRMVEYIQRQGWNSVYDVERMRMYNRYEDRTNRIIRQDIELLGQKLSTGVSYGSADAGQHPDWVYGVTGTLGETSLFNLTYTYDAFGRRTGRTLGGLTTGYSYLTGANGNATTLVSEVNNGGDAWAYTYDALDNITTVSRNGSLYESYTYDSLNQLKTVTDASVNVTEYTYDNGGNILNVKRNGAVVKTYTYGDTNWKDLLTGYNGQSFTYDAIGNPLTYRDGMNLAWQYGRQLQSVCINANTTAYTYNGDGIRTTKTVGGVTTEYYFDTEGTILAENRGGTQIRYLFDESGTRIGLYVNNAAYFYDFNLQGDIVAIRNNGAIVARYTYDVWGKVLSVTDANGNAITDASHIANINPFRYRNYYYDTETGLYYVSSRYYDPEIGRFINADAAIGQIGNVQGTNMFAYCFNNPVNMSDPTGNWPKLSTIFTVVAVAAVAVAAVAVTVATCGAAAPALAVAGGGIIGGISAGAAATAASVATGAMIVAGVSTAAAVTSAVAEKAVEKSAKQNNSVYVLKDDTGTVQYVGRTTDVAKRAKAHEANPARAGLKLEVIQPNLNYVQARAVEQAAMAYYHTINTANKMNNQINGISPFNPKLGIYKEAAVGMLGYTWNQVSNEILYWTGN